MLHYVAHALRGFLIGIAEIIPGISGGTIALITGIYDDLIRSIGHFFRGIVSTLSSTARKSGKVRLEFRQVKWSVIIPVGIFMLTGIVVGAAALGPIITNYPEFTHAFFFGLIIVSLYVPIRMVGKDWNIRLIGLTAIFAVLTFLFMSLPRAQSITEVPLPFVAAAAALAICALVLPGLSGAFILLVIGIYEPTIAAVNNRDIAYLLTFIGGAIIGIALFVSFLQWLLEHHRPVTLAIMTGLMVGSLRAIWPWQGPESELLTPANNWPTALLFTVIGALIIVIMLITEHFMSNPKISTNQSPTFSSPEK